MGKDRAFVGGLAQEEIGMKVFERTSQLRPRTGVAAAAGARMTTARALATVLCVMTLSVFLQVGLPLLLAALKS